MLSSNEERRILSESYTFIKALLFELSSHPEILATCLITPKRSILEYTSLLRTLTHSFFEDLNENSRTLLFIYHIMKLEIIGINDIEEIKGNMIFTAEIMRNFFEKPQFNSYLNSVIVNPLNEVLKIKGFLDIGQSR